MTTLSQYDAFGVDEEHDQLAIFGGPGAHERAIEAELAKVAVLVPESTDARPRRGMFGTPGWYEEKCAALSAASWAKQLTLEEELRELDLWHHVMLATMELDKLYRTFGRARGQRVKKAVFRWQGYRCRECGGLVGPLTGLCHPCHFGGWWR